MAPGDDMMSSFQLSEEVRAMLRIHGWHEGRRIDIGVIEDFLKGKGIDVHATAREFLQEFHGLHFQLPDGGITSVDFNVHEEMTFIERDELAQLEFLVHQSLCPIGLGGRFLFFIASSGEFIFLHDEWLLYLRTKTVSEAFEVIRSQDCKPSEMVMLTNDQKPAGFRDTN